jgi:tripartite-type tricarboxylate transporter receptor subunit TctC
MKARMHSINVVVPIQSPEEISKRLEEDTRSNAEVIKAANIKLE